jgi:hypothetical protein
VSRHAGFSQTERTKARIAGGMHKSSDSRYGPANSAPLDACVRCGSLVSTTMRDQTRYMGGGAYCSWICSKAAEAEAPVQEEGELL